MNIYLQGLTMGLAYVAPIGLQNLFVINSALTQRRSRVYLTALIVILWDVSLGVSCFLGAGALMQAVPVVAEGHSGAGQSHRHLDRYRAAAVQGIAGGRQGCERAGVEALHHRLRGDVVQSAGPSSTAP